MTGLISVIVPVYQVDQYLGQCVESLMAQTYPHLEIILVDDGSTDRCPELCDLYASKDKRIRVIHQQNKGLVGARKAGVRAATGDWIGYVDGDDRVDPSYYERLLKAASEADADIAVTGYSRDFFDLRVPFAGAAQKGVIEGDDLRGLYTVMIAGAAFFEHTVTTYVWNKLFKRDIVLPVQEEVDERITIGEDAAVTYPALLQAKRICVTEDTCYHYRQREDSMLKQTAPFSEEKEGLRILYAYLMRIAAQYPDKYKLGEQVGEFLLEQCIIRSGGRLHDCNGQMIYHVFDQASSGKKVAIYSAGTFGQRVVRDITEQGEQEIFAWVDEDYREYRRCCMDVDPVETLENSSAEAVWIASLTPSTTESMRKKLIQTGIRDDIIQTAKRPPGDAHATVRGVLYEGGEVE